ncbi:hypothetical protein SODALDRAFT_213417 [Sodiomyces alkalinus F11]|uniref:HMG box domain-containing protein n=1 Tax=Sodiomyces alkalinus (strain CBS 110278 / VKM F-3762 / F11) TaxID=1314773 RepID=A0A3N2PRP1_SODAK|nr:hypothetical protein SODALDRAFT_213417 [Sodiomyces alkalinus F11]ROT37026.1 hypothetical protein SODALDRAFT_213417 [Sodiomyces alkalinus F11]
MGESGYRPYNTPDTSPPTPARGADVLTTRSGLTIQKRPSTNKPLAARGARVEKQSPRKKKDKSKATKKIDEIRIPLSELAEEHPEVLVADIDAYVNRPAEERMREVEQSKTPGKIKRPMNAFMLYRKAYQNLAKSLCTQNNHQMVSQVCGSGWPLEPEHVRGQFNEWAKIERMNHQEAHPGYKFTPSKPKPKPQEDRNLRSEDGDLDDFDWATGRAVPKNRQTKRPNHTRHEAPPSIFHSYPAIAGSPPAMSSHHMYHCSDVERSLPGSYGHDILPPGEYYQQSARQRQDAPGFMEDMVIRRPSPTMGYVAGLIDERYEPLDPYGHGPPHGVLGSVLGPEMSEPNGHSYGDSGGGGYGDPLLGDHQRWPHHLISGEAALPMYDDAYLDPQLQLLRGQDHSWKVEELDGSHYNDWMEHPE